MTAPLILDGSPLSIPDVESVARASRPVQLAETSRAAMARSRAVIDSALSDGQSHYGINTGFGSLSRNRIEADGLRDLQVNLIRSHAAGVGAPLPVDIVRAMLLILAASLSRGLSGVRPQVVEHILSLLNADITPIVPSIGSVGASGDLAPLAHIGLALIGEGNVLAGSAQVSPAAAALAAARLRPLTLEAKEGLAIINGTHLMAAQGVLLCADTLTLFDAALAAAAMSIDACRATDSFLDPRIHTARNQPGQSLVADRLRTLLAGSQIIPSHRDNDPRVQDPYSLRCTPQVLGAAWDAMGYVKLAIENELAAVTDNPLVFTAEPVSSSSPTSSLRHSVSSSLPCVISAGNFHGMPLAIPLDVLTIALSHIAGIAERRVFWLLSAFDAESHLQPYLSPKPGLCSGLMIAQYTAAACCNEIIGLATPASVSNIGTSAGIEDYNSFGPRAAAKARRALELTTNVIAIELLCASQGLEAHRPLRSGAGVERAHTAIRSVVAPLNTDRPPSPDIAAIADLITRGHLS